MARTDVLSLVQTLSNGQADPSLVGRYYSDFILDLGNRPWLTNSTLVAVTGLTAAYDISTNIIQLLEVYYDDRVLDKTPLAVLQMYSPNWRDIKGPPMAYTEDDQPTTKTIQLFPNPEVDSKTFSFPTGTPFGLDYPGSAIVLLHTENRADLPPYLELPAAFFILAREFERDSNHRDEQFAVVCQQVHELLMRMVG